MSERGCHRINHVKDATRIIKVVVLLASVTVALGHLAVRRRSP
jgi:hypothetical protein